jgi:hypothetical protein
MKNTHEMKVLRDFITEFNPFYTKEMVMKLNYLEMISIVKEIVKEFN